MTFEHPPDRVVVRLIRSVGHEHVMASLQGAEDESMNGMFLNLLNQRETQTAKCHTTN